MAKVGDDKSMDRFFVLFAFLLFVVAPLSIILINIGVENKIIDKQLLYYSLISGLILTLIIGALCFYKRYKKSNLKKG